jgi:hypothetical protein
MTPDLDAQVFNEVVRTQSKRICLNCGTSQIH